MFDYPTSRWVEIAHMRWELHVRTRRGARVRSRPLAYIRTGCMHIVVQCNGPALATVEVNKTTLAREPGWTREAEGDRFVRWDFADQTERTRTPAIQQQWSIEVPTNLAPGETGA